MNQLQAVAAQVTQGAANAVQYDSLSKTSVTLGGTASADGGVSGGTKITNVSQGAVNATSTDAVNGSQLYAVTQQIGGNTLAQANAYTDTQISQITAATACSGSTTAATWPRRRRRAAIRSPAVPGPRPTARTRRR